MSECLLVVEFIPHPKGNGVSFEPRSNASSLVSPPPPHVSSPQTEGSHGFAYCKCVLSV